MTGPNTGREHGEAYHRSPSALAGETPIGSRRHVVVAIMVALSALGDYNA